jgi:hypothetical protein
MQMDAGSQYNAQAGSSGIVSWNQSSAGVVRPAVPQQVQQQQQLQQHQLVENVAVEPAAAATYHHVGTGVVGGEQMANVGVQGVVQGQAVAAPVDPAAAAKASNNLKWEQEEALGAKATISAVLYANIHHPTLIQQFPSEFFTFCLKNARTTCSTSLPNCLSWI